MNRRLSAHGLALSLPKGCEARIYRRRAPEGSEAFPILQAATFPLSPSVGDFGSGAVEVMGPGDVFLSLVEFAPEQAAAALFAHRGMPRALHPSAFHPHSLKRPIRDEAGVQRFFTEVGRPFILYAVLGSYAARGRLVPRVNELLRSVVVQP